jgi:hypothetical protein
MNRIDINSHLNDSESLVFVVGNDEILDNKEEYDNNYETPRPAKQARRSTVQDQENSHSMDIDSKNRIPLSELTNSFCCSHQCCYNHNHEEEQHNDHNHEEEQHNDEHNDLNNIVETFQEKIKLIYFTDQQLFHRTMTQLQANYKLLDLLLKFENQNNEQKNNANETNNDDENNNDDEMNNHDETNNEHYIADFVSIFESASNDEYEIEFMEKELAKEHTNAMDVHYGKMIRGESIVIEENDPTYQKIEDHEEFMNMYADESTKISLLGTDNIGCYKKNQLGKSEYRLLLQVIQSEDLRNNPKWNHSIDLYHHSKDSRANEIMLNDLIFNRDGKEVLISEEEYNKSPNDFIVQARYLVRKDLMLRLRLYKKIKRSSPWFRKDINVMKVYGMNNDTIFVKNLQMESRLKEETLYRWLVLQEINACLVVFGVALEKGFSPLHPKSDCCTATYKVGDEELLIRVGYCLGGKERFAGFVGHDGICIFPDCGNLAAKEGKCMRHAYGECSVDGCYNVVLKEGKCKRHAYGECSVVGCYNVAYASGKCQKHAYGECSVVGCYNVAYASGKCQKHADGECSVADCSNLAVKSNGKCERHADGECSVDGCTNVVKKDGKCQKHAHGECSVDGCTNVVHARGKCKKHAKMDRILLV